MQMKGIHKNKHWGRGGRPQPPKADISMRLFSILTIVPLPWGRTRPLPKLLSTQYHHSTHSWLSTPSSYLIFSKRVREIHLITEGLEYIQLHCKSHSVRCRWWFIHTYSNRQLTPLLSMPRCIQLGFPLPGLLLNRSAFRIPSKVWMWDLVDISSRRIWSSTCLIPTCIHIYLNMQMTFSLNFWAVQFTQYIKILYVSGKKSMR